MAGIPLTTLLRELDPMDFKAHFAIWNGSHHPLDVFARDRIEWEAWNRYRRKRDDFNRRYIFSMAHVYTEQNVWLFGGIYKMLGQDATGYLIERVQLLQEYEGRLKIGYKLPGRNIRVRLENHLSNMIVSEILKEPYTGQPFTGYESIDLGYEQLEVIMRNDRPDWRGALENVKGVYLVCDKHTGRKYVGSAYGMHGVWSRWRCYIDTGHGWNDGLTALLSQKGQEYARQNFKFTLLESHPARVTDAFVIEREGFWKDALLTRTEFGYNKN